MLIGLSGTSQNVTGGIQIAGQIGTQVGISTGAIAAGSLAVPIIGAAIAGVTLLIGSWLNSIAKHNAEKAATTQIVNTAEPLLKQNVTAYLSTPTHTVSEQAQALANYDNIWAQVVKACSTGGYEAAGQRCVSDRSPGGKFPWATWYRDPIANSTTVPDPLTGVSGLLSGLTSGSAAGLLLPAALVIAALFFVK